MVEACRPIILPNSGFLKCLDEFGKELSGERTGVYAPAPKAQGLQDLDFELPPEWAASPTHAKATLEVSKGSEVIESLPVGEHDMYTFGRSLTCDFPLEHASISRNHAALCHHENGGLYVIDLKSSHGTQVNGRALKPFEATLLRAGSVVGFGASSRTYTLRGVPPPPREADPESDDEARGASSSAGVAEGPMRPGEERKRKWSAADKRARRAQKYLGGGQKSSSQMSENERVARMAGGGSGCMGPGFD